MGSLVPLDITWLMGGRMMFLKHTKMENTNYKLHICEGWDIALYIYVRDAATASWVVQTQDSSGPWCSHDHSASPIAEAIYLYLHLLQWQLRHIPFHFKVSWSSNMRYFGAIFPQLDLWHKPHRWRNSFYVPAKIASFSSSPRGAILWVFGFLSWAIYFWIRVIPSKIPIDIP